jgi:hypothetical protein
MARVYKPVRVEVAGSHGYWYGLAIPDPPKTRTRDTGLTGITGVAELRVLRDVTVAIHESCETRALCRKQRFRGFCKQAFP